MKEEKNNKKTKNIALGILLGLIFGAAWDNVSLGLCLGLIFGMTMNARNHRQDK